MRNSFAKADCPIWINLPIIPSCWPLNVYKQIFKPFSLGLEKGIERDPPIFTHEKGGKRVQYFHF